MHTSFQHLAMNEVARMASTICGYTQVVLLVQESSE